ncbi:carbohydrate porin [Moritella sp. 24]|uniref:carbohydrate porin n=1 Tax=Moritella sp. 24 TaxID=2746230 RepID=UPI001BAA6154|nr:carbohydrate porin [Moritella sp. 24]QUM78084.1 carbohydrate porin [Moritella sp. 24]
MKKAFIMLPLAVACASQFAVAATTDAQRLAQLEQELAMLQEASSYDSLSDRMSINGFFTGQMGVANNDAGYGNRPGVEGYTSDPDFSLGSKLGLQGTFALTEQTQIVAQLVSRGADDWTPEMEWAFLSHDFDNGFTTRIGRLRVPLYMYSDYLEVGYAQPWANPPADVYSIVPVSSYDGIDIIYDTDLGDASLSLQASYGHDVDDAEDNPLGVDVKFKNTIGMSATLSYEEWVFRGTYFQSELESGDVAIPDVPAQPFEKFDNEKAQFAGVGISYDNGSFLAISEYTISKVEGKYSDTKSGYITLGYRINAFTPYVNYSFLETTDNDERAPTAVDDYPNLVGSSAFNWERTTYSVGSRYDISSNLSLKLDVTYATDFGDTHGALPSHGSETYDDTIVYTVSFDAVF